MFSGTCPRKHTPVLGEGHALSVGLTFPLACLSTLGRGRAEKQTRVCVRAKPHHLDPNGIAPQLSSESRPPAAVFKCVKTSTKNGESMGSDSETSRLLSEVNDFQLSGNMSPWPPGPSFRVHSQILTRHVA